VNAYVTKQRSKAGNLMKLAEKPKVDETQPVAKKEETVVPAGQ